MFDDSDNADDDDDVLDIGWDSSDDDEGRKSTSKPNTAPFENEISSSDSEDGDWDHLRASRRSEIRDGDDSDDEALPPIMKK